MPRTRSILRKLFILKYLNRIEIKNTSRMHKDCYTKLLNYRFKKAKYDTIKYERRLRNFYIFIWIYLLVIFHYNLYKREY